MEKRNLKLIVALAIAMAFAIASLIVGYVMSGADVIAWLSSRYAITIYIFVGIYALLVVFLWLVERNKRL